ncbi:hypothetical protein B484DRAFT_399326 [Ochromonadaceae sp. CCMP2298]|nr:hypothetical protein B484DRAFT_399326 [Ochromonadaceae sp. CCMP2298]
MQSRSKAPTPVSPIDSDEQENIMMQLKADAITQSLQIRNIFFFLYLAIAGIMIVCIFYTIAAPYHMQHQKHFEYLVQIEIFYLFYASSAYTFIVGAFIAKQVQM